MAVEDRGAFVVVDDGAASADLALAAGGFQAVFGLLDDVAAPVSGEREGQVKDEGALGVLSGSDAFQDLDADALLEEVVEDDESFQEVAAEPVDFLDGEEVGPVGGGEFAAGLLLEDLPNVSIKVSER